MGLLVERMLQSETLRGIELELSRHDQSCKSCPTFFSYPITSSGVAAPIGKARTADQLELVKEVPQTKNGDGFGQRI